MFWRTTLAEWRVMLDAYADQQDVDMRKRAWVVSHLLVAAGCDPEKVTIAKLLGEKERRGRVLDPEAKARKDAAILWERLQKQKGAERG